MKIFTRQSNKITISFKVQIQEIKLFKKKNLFTPFQIIFKPQPFPVPHTLAKIPVKVISFIICLFKNVFWTKIVKHIKNIFVQ